MVQPYNGGRKLKRAESWLAFLNFALALTHYLCDFIMLIGSRLMRCQIRICDLDRTLPKLLVRAFGVWFHY